MRLLRQYCVLGLGLLAQIFLNTAAAAADDGPSLGEIKLQNFRYGGSGCPAGMASGLIQEDGDSLTIIFDDFLIASDSQRGARSHCQVNFDLTARGWQHALFSVETRGYASIDEGASATIKTTYQVPGEKSATIGRTLLRGYMEDDYSEAFNIPLESANWSKCEAHQTLSLDIKIRLSTPKHTEAVLSVDTIDGSLSNHVGVIWRNCDPKKRKKFIAVCKVDRKWSKKGKTRKSTVMAHVKAKSRQGAKDRAKRKVQRKCSKKKAKRGGRCGPVSCKVQKFSD
jgi:hypothetical protein